jgi:NAD(P)-dependent dehydrogenase (short-subunit alcohol dehydrogenase family)
MLTRNVGMYILNQKCAVVVGGTSGIGRAIAIGLARAGANVVSTLRSINAVETVAGEIEAIGRSTLRHTSDVLDQNSLHSLRESVLAGFGRVDILVDSAGITKKMKTLECSDEDWNNIMAVNLTGTLRAGQIFGASMIRQNYGRIVNIASLSTFVAFHEVAAYGASKAPVGALTRSLEVEWAGSGVCLNAIAPGIISTELNRSILETSRGQELFLRTPMHRFGTAEELAGAAVYLAFDASSFTTGQIIRVNGGFSSSGVNQ